MTFPLVDKNDDGIRPAGAPDECFYCKQKVGQTHKADCVIVTKKVKVRYSFEIEIDIPHHWTEEVFLSHRMESSWCADNALTDLMEIADREDDCLCSRFDVALIGTVDETPKRELREEL